MSEPPTAAEFENLNDEQILEGQRDINLEVVLDVPAHCLGPKQIALYYNGPMKVFQIQDDWGMQHLKLATRPQPKAGPGQVLLRMKAASLNYRDLVVPMRGFSALAGCLALAVIVIPVVLRTTEDMLLLVPNALREAASALGLPRSMVIKRIAYRSARSGLITGVLLATARVAGETAPLLFTALSNQFFSLSLNKTMANLPVTINNFVQSPYAYWKQLAWSGALLITLTVLALNIGARILGAERTAK